MTSHALDRLNPVGKQAPRPQLSMLAHVTARGALYSPRILALLATGCYLWLFLRIQWRIGDEGSIVYGAARVVDGAIPYRDFFEVMGPGAFYWLALWFKALGTSWFSSRVAVLATALVSASAIYYATTRHYRGRWAAVPAALYTLVTVPLWPGANHHFDANMWVLLAFAVTVSASRFKRTSAILTGVLAGLASTVMPQKGTLVLAGLCIAKLIDENRGSGWRRALVDIFWMLGPFLAVGASVIVFFWSRNALPELVYANAIWPATQYHTVNVVPYAYNLREFAFYQFAPIFQAVFPAPVSLIATVFATVPFAFIAILPFIAAGLLLYRATTRTPDSLLCTAVPWSYWCAGFALFVSECHRPEMNHLTYASPILLVTVFLWLGRARGFLAVVMRRTLVSSIALVAAALALVGTGPATAMETRNGEIRTFGSDEALEFLQQNVAAGERVFVYPYYPMYYFLADVRNPTRYSILMYHINTTEQFDEVIRDLEIGQVKYVLWDTLVAGENLTRWFPGYQDPPANEQRLERYVEGHYTIIGLKNRFRVLQRNSQRNSELVVSSPASE